MKKKMNRLMFCRISMLVVVAGLAASQTAFSQTLIDLENSVWTHPSGTSTGWDSSQLTGYSTLSDGNVVTMTVSFAGSAVATGANLTIIDETYFKGFAIQMDPATNTNTGASFLNYERLDFEFAQPVLINDFRVTDVDRSTWDDVIFVEGWNTGLGALGTGQTANYSFNGTTNLAEETLFGLNQVVVASGGNTVSGPESDLFVDFGSNPVNALSLYYWNGDYASSADTQTVGITSLSGEEGFYVETVPEPSGFLLLSSGLAFLIMRRPRRAVEAEKSAS